jgi:pimeloyl-ACP methyl ester carboxylesterase
MDTTPGFADVNGTRLHYEIAGTGNAVVFIHGFGSDRRVWDDQFPAFARRYQVLRYDIRGHGQSALPTGEPYAHADDLLALLNFLGIARTHIIGQSMGGEIAINFALVYPDRVHRLALVDSALGGYQWSAEWYDSWTPIWAGAPTAGKEATLALVVNHPLVASAMNHPQVKPRLARIFGDYSIWHFVNADPVRHPDPPAIQRLHELKMPALIITGEYTLPDFHAIASILKQGIPGAVYLEFAGVGHVIPMESPEQLNEAVLRFLAGE